jgi:hypothetical protein
MGLLYLYSSLISCTVTQEGQFPLRTPFQNWKYSRKYGLLLRSLKSHKHARGKWFASVAHLFVAPQTRLWKMFRFSRASICGATNTLVVSGSLQSRTYLWRHKHARAKWFASVAHLFVAQQTRVENGSLQLRAYLWCHKHARGKWFASVALLFVAPQTRSWKRALKGSASKLSGHCCTCLLQNRAGR